MNPTGYLVLESELTFQGRWYGGKERAGEVVFNTSHSGYEEIATDPSYYNQIMVMTAPMQGNYGESNDFWESRQMWIQGFVCLEMQQSQRDRSWQSKLVESNIPILSHLDTRKLVIYLRSQGTEWGALVQADSLEQAKDKAKTLIEKQKTGTLDWTSLVTRENAEDIKGDLATGPRIAVLDFGCKQNIIRELKKRCQDIRVFPSRISSDEILQWKPDGVLLSNGPGDPMHVEPAVQTIQSMLGKTYVFGICMGHQLLSRALGGQTERLKFGHRGSNHPIRDELLNQVYMTSQNHGYVVAKDSLPKEVKVTHTNLNDQTVAGIESRENRCMSVQFHPESHPGPHDSENLFDYFVKQLK